MAKLNITFVNEVGNNLNRYKAIDVNTGDEYLFDLSRNGTITTPGTPLNAEIMNAIVSAINEQFSNLVETINDETPSNTNYPSEKAVVDYVGQIANEESVNVSDNVLIKVSGVSDNLAIPPESQMEVNSIEGNSVVVNQLVRNLVATKTVNGVTFTNNGDGTMTLNGTATEDIGTVSIGEKLTGDFKVPRRNNKCLVSFGCQDKEGINFGVTGYPIYNKPYFLFQESNDTDWNGDLRCRILNGTTFDNFIIRPTFHNLTQWFGSNDNIPQDILNTPSNFFKHYKGSLAYDTGHIENGSGNLVDTNRNIWDEKTRKGYYNTHGEFVPDNSYIACLNPIIVNPNEAIYWHSGSGSHGRCCWYDNDDNFISSVMGSVLLSAPSNARYLRFDMTSSYGNTYKHDICINVSDTNFNGTYVSHIKNTLDFGNDTLRSAGNARDKKTPDGEIERKVGRVDLGTLDWGPGGDTGAWYIAIPDAKVGAKSISSHFSNAENGLYTNMNNLTGAFNSDQNIYYCKDERYTNLSTFKAAMSGVILYYELATPTIEQGTPYDNYIPVYYGGQEFTTGDVPFVINKNYDISIKDQVITNVRVDKEQSEQIHALEIANREQSNAIDSLQNEVSNLEITQEAHSTSISSLTTKVTDLENSKFDSSKLKIEQTLTKTTLKYNEIKISEIDSVDVSITPQIYIECTQTDAYNYTEKITVTNNTSYDMYVSMVGQSTHNAFIVPYGETESSTKTLSFGAEGGSIPANYTAEIEIKIYYNLKTNYNATIGYTDIENVKTINLRATVHTTDR